MAKLGVIAESNVPAYSEYVRRLRSEFSEVIELESHHGWTIDVLNGILSHSATRSELLPIGVQC